MRALLLPPVLALVGAVLVAGGASAPAADRPTPRPLTGSFALSSTPAIATAPRAGVERREASLTAANRAPGFPTRPEPHFQLAQVNFTLDLDDAEFYGNVTLGAALPSDVDPTILYAVGTLAQNTCTVSAPAISDYFPDSYQTSHAAEDLPAGWADANCAVAVLRLDGTDVDALVGPVTDVLPQLALGAPTLLDSRRLRLVPGIWTQLDVPVTNLGPGVADGIVVSGAGRGLKVRPGSLPYSLGAEQQGTAEVRVKLTGRSARARLKLTAQVGSVHATGQALVRRTAPPAAPLPGSYRSQGGEVTFAITPARTVTGFRVRTQTTCGGYPDFPTTTSNIYDFPRSKVPRNGIVDRSQKGALFGASLRFKVAGARVSKGRFSYSGPNRCHAIESFTARRVGR